jgi:uncharacterized protein (TIGR03435 family)
MKFLVRALWLIAALTPSVTAQNAGDNPPALVWDSLKGDCPGSLDWSSLRGKVVVVSFSPGDVLPSDVNDWKDAAQNYQGDRVSFIQIVGGSEFLLDQALKQTLYNACIVFDRDLRNLKNFKLPPLERTVVIDQLGFIAGYAFGRDDMKDALRSVLNNQPDNGLYETPPLPRPYDPADGLDRATDYEVHISGAPRTELRSLGASAPDLYIAKNQPLKLIILDLWETPLAWISFPQQLAEGNYDVTAHMPGIDRELLLQIVREAVERRFGLRIEREVRMERVYVLTTLPNPSQQLQPTRNGEKWMCGAAQGSIIGTAQAVPDIARAFEALMNVPVVDGTGLKGKYNYSASTKLPPSEAAFDLAHQLGLDLTEAERPIEMLVVRNLQ